MFYNINNSVNNNYCYVNIKNICYNKYHNYKSIMKELFDEELCTNSESSSDE